METIRKMVQTETREVLAAVLKPHPESFQEEPTAESEARSARIAALAAELAAEQELHARELQEMGRRAPPPPVPFASRPPSDRTAAPEGRRDIRSYPGCTICGELNPLRLKFVTATKAACEECMERWLAAREDIRLGYSWQ